MERLLWRLLSAAISFCSFLGAVNDPVGIPLHRVNGVLRRSVSLSVNDISRFQNNKTIEWDFQLQNETNLLIAEVIDGKFERPDPKDRFGPRLELANETTLRIQNLEKEDSGIYNAHVKFPPAEIEEYIFHLMVYDPVPEPRILFLHETSDFSAKCTVDLHCAVSKNTGLNVSWRIGAALEPLEGGPDWYWFSSEGWSLHLSSPMDFSVTCLVSNPADQKSASIDLIGICPRPGGRERLWREVFPLVIVAVITTVFALGHAFICRKKERNSPCKCQTKDPMAGHSHWDWDCDGGRLLKLEEKQPSRKALHELLGTTNSN